MCEGAGGCVRVGRLSFVETVTQDKEVTRGGASQPWRCEGLRAGAPPAGSRPCGCCRPAGEKAGKGQGASALGGPCWVLSKGVTLTDFNFKGFPLLLC